MTKKINWVVGHPIAHSQSPVLHNAIYQELGLDALMQAKEYSDAKQLVADIRREQVGLTAVTMPLKSNIVQHLDELSDEAKKLQAVNTIIYKNNKLFGYNTDLTGIEYALRNTNLDNKKILIIGAGAVAKILGYYLKQKTNNLFWLNRSREKSEGLAKIYGGSLMKDSVDLDLVINASPLGMHSHPGLPLPADLITQQQTVFDVVYNPLETELLKLAAAKGARVISGLDMFVMQALKQIELWSARNCISEKNLDSAKSEVIRGVN